MYGTAEKMEYVNTGAAPEKFGRRPLRERYDCEPDKGQVGCEDKDDLMQPAPELLTGNEDVAFEEVIEAVNRMGGLPAGPATLYLDLEKAQEIPPLDNAETCSDYVNCKCATNYIKLALPVHIDKTGVWIACKRCHAAMSECPPAKLPEVREAGLLHGESEAA